MSRPLRVEYKDAIYHVMNRGRRRENIFIDDGDRYLFLSVLSEAFKLFHAKIYSYCLMPNHYHLLLSTPEANISRVMRHINGVYTQKINKKHKLEGALFKGRYKSILIDGDNYFKECICYIHCNPIKAGLERKLGIYEWSSHKYYHGSKEKQPNWFCVDEALSYFGKYKKIAMKEYNLCVHGNASEDFEKRLKGSNWPSVLGSDTFKERVKQIIFGKDLSEISSQELKDGLPAKLIVDVLNMFLRCFGMTLEQYNSKQNEYCKVRSFVVRYCREKLNFQNVDIAKELEVSTETISRSYRKIKDDKEYDSVVNNLEMKTVML
ncbi:MAG: hypothetical protein GY858_02790 [Candidatus Omnitrophica bacterium]|nr:hypothetical protein [Candidatus Omnitrophota bacterium]